MLRHRINECFEIASLPDTPPEKRKELLSFVLVNAFNCNYKNSVIMIME